MPLSAGTRLGPYEILAPLGAGGMGEVYEARDTRLDRTVAIKVLPERLTGDPQFRERFEREARAVSSLNHPNICVLYDIGEQQGMRFLAMECLEGESLAARLERGALPPAEALRCAIEIAGALDAAHRHGVIHRDLKPGNIMLTRTGAKLLDFGLAKVRAAAATPEHTATMSMTTEGSILGTFQYMSPEQLEGRDADARSDIFGFGAVLYEMLAGRRAFEGKSHAGLIAAIMTSQPPPVSAAPAPSLPVLDRVVRRCLAKDPDDRWQTARDLRQELVWILEGGSQQAAAAEGRKSRAGMAWGVAGVLAVAAMVLAVLLLRQEKPAARPLRFSIHAPEGTTGVVSRPAISPDGENIVFNAVAGGQTHLYLNSLATGQTRQLTGTEGGGSASWSFDSRAFLLLRGTDPLGASLVRMDLSGAPPQPLTLPFQPFAPQDWGPEGAVSGGSDGLYWFQPDGSGVRQLRAAGPEQAGGIRAPSLIPGSRWLIYNSLKVNSGIANPAAIHVASLDGKTDRLLFTTDSNYGFYAAPGYILYLQGTSLMASPLDPKSGQLRGEAQSVLEGAGPFSTSANGVLAYRPGTAAADSQLTWFDRSGNNLGAVGSPAEFSSPALSPDGNRVAVGIRDPAAKTRDIWVLDLSRGSQSKLTFDPKDDLSATWSPDGSRIAFTSDRRGARDLYVKSASGTGEDELLLESKLDKNIEAWSPDGRVLIYNQASHGLWTWSFDTRKAQPFLQGKSVALHGRFSPDSKWVAYTSYESGRAEIYVRPFADASPGAQGQWLVSSGGGVQPQWRGDGKELFYTSLAQPPQIMALDIEERNGAILHGTPHALFDARIPPGIGRNRWVASRDGKKFLLIVPVGNGLPTRIEVVLNWPSLLRKP